MKYLVDTNVLSEPTKAAPDGQVMQWLEYYEQDLVVSSVVLAELYLGVLTMPEGRKRKVLEHWFIQLADTITCIDWDKATGLRWARLVADLRRKGRSMPLVDSMIAATALEHTLTLATRNTSDFRPAGVQVVNPFG